MTDFEEIEKARERLRKYFLPTPAVRSEVLSDTASLPVWLKLELLQPTGSFKVRPSMNGMLANLEQARAKGVVTSSSGNFAQGAAYAAKRLGVDLQVVMMKGASEFKRKRTEALGATVVLCEDTFKDRWDTTYRIEKEEQRLLIHPYDSVHTMGGDGTIGLELLEQIEGEFCAVVPISGGGLISGIATAIKHKRPGCRVIGVQPAANGSMRKSLDAGERVTVTPGPTLADALLIAQPGERTFEVVRRLVDEVVAVDEDEIRAAVKLLAEEQKLVVEGGGAVGVAALRGGKVAAGGLPVVCILSGGNILPSDLAAILAA
ncbi:MAG: threonine/serine dehydratase [Acidobacteria bacterium]|nr:threonine/serine dehydratase [Acidobacteriota bacterium]